MPDTDPLDALYEFRKNIFDLVILDLKMPKMSGMLLYQKLPESRILIFYFVLLLQIKNTSNTLKQVLLRLKRSSSINQFS